MSVPDTGCLHVTVRDTLITWSSVSIVVTTIHFLGQCIGVEGPGADCACKFSDLTLNVVHTPSRYPCAESRKVNIR